MRPRRFVVMVKAARVTLDTSEPGGVSPQSAGGGDGEHTIARLCVLDRNTHDGDDPSLSSTFLMLNCFHPAPQGVNAVCSNIPFTVTSLAYDCGTAEASSTLTFIRCLSHFFPGRRFQFMQQNNSKTRLSRRRQNPKFIDVCIISGPFIYSGGLSPSVYVVIVFISDKYPLYFKTGPVFVLTCGATYRLCHG
ncbi:hypothetical protein F2P81_007086 [Scophthalmus maximus]|uniref:Uncharacterized protein n=1 Tax=Scophthalmus maximus TaxID=52904 RepID=A0A6A4T9X2_SCOMX|nr:hypothetical protein F2P81_007086 [Scophthalmus maximus]